MEKINQKFIKKNKKEIVLSEIESSELSSEILDFAPIECMDCGFNRHIPSKHFLVSTKIKTSEDQEDLERQVKKQLGYSSFRETSCKKGHLISVSRCPKCSSEELFIDY